MNGDSPAVGTIARWAAEAARLTAEAEELDARLEKARARLRGVLAPGRHLAGRWVVTVSAQRRFDPELVPAEYVDAVTETVVSAEKAKAELPPAVYDRCRVEAGRHRVRVHAARDEKR